MKKYGLLGEKLGHSYSKMIHEAISDTYELIEVSKEDFDAFMLKADFDAINVTIPYKEKVIPYLDQIDAKALSELLKLVDKKEISTTAGKQVFEEMWNTGDSAESLVEKLGLKQMNNDDELKAMVEAAISANPQSVADYKGGKTSAIGFLVGQVMKASKGKANPQKVNEMLKSLLD